MVRRSLFASGVVSLVLVACERKPGEVAETRAAAPGGPVAPDAASEVKGPTPPIPSAAMVEQLLAQQVLDHPRVRPYLHTEIAANLPLRVAPSADLAQGAAALVVAGQAVQVVTPAQARVVFTGQQSIGAARVRVGFEIPAEGVVGHVDLELADHVWRAIDASVVER